MKLTSTNYSIDLKSHHEQRLEYKYSDILPATTVLNHNNDLLNEMANYTYFSNTLRKLLIEEILGDFLTID